MAVDDLDRISGLKGRSKSRHRAVLAELGILTGHQLALTERALIVDALRAKALDASLEEVAVWQDEARRLVRQAPAAATTADWEQVGSFVVSFERRTGRDATEQQLVVVRTEDNGPSVAIPTKFEGWDCGEACDWMRTQLDADQLERAAADERQAEQTAAAAKPATRAEPDEAPPRLCVEDVQLDEGGETVGVSLDAAAPELVSHGAGRFVVRVGRAPSGGRVEVALRRRRANGPSEAVGEPVSVAAGKSAELELAGLGEGVHELKLEVWASGCLPARVLLPPLVIGPSE
jgi:hypothetical protein